MAWDGRGFRLLGASAAMADCALAAAAVDSDRVMGHRVTGHGGHAGERQRAAMRLNLAYGEYAREAEQGWGVEVDLLRDSWWGEAGAAGSARRSSGMAACLRPSSARPASARLPTSRDDANGYGDDN